MNYNIINDYIIKVPLNNPYNKPKLEGAKVIISNNSVIQNSKLLVPLINTIQSITGQYPSVIYAKKSVASFKLRKGSSTGLLTTLRREKLANYLSLLNIYFIPRTIESKNIGGLWKSFENSTYSFGMDNISVFSFVAPLEESLQVSHSINKLSPSKLTGGYTQLSYSYTLPKQYVNSKSGVKAPKGLVPVASFINKYFWSTLYLPIGVNIT